MKLHCLNSIANIASAFLTNKKSDRVHIVLRLCISSHGERSQSAVEKKKSFFFQKEGANLVVFVGEGANPTKCTPLPQHSVGWYFALDKALGEFELEVRNRLKSKAQEIGDIVTFAEIESISI